MATLLILSASIALVLICLTPGCDASNYDCLMDERSSRNVQISLDPKDRKTDHFIPRIEQQSSRWTAVHSDYFICTWQLYNHDKERTRHLYLQGIPTESLWKTARSELFLSFQLSSFPRCPTTMANKSVKVTSGMRQLISLPHGAYVNVSLVLSRQIGTNSTHIIGAVTLRIDILDDGFCARDIPSYNGGCYTITDEEMPLKELLESIGRMSSDGAVHLAWFSSYGQIEQFVKANMEIKKPLNLTQPVRLGLFYKKRGSSNQLDGLVFLSENKTGHCAFVHVTCSNLIWNIRGAASNTSCISLHVDSQSGSPVLQHADCRHPLRALVSFPELPGPGSLSCAKCTADIVESLTSSAPSVDSSSPKDTELRAAVIPRSEMIKRIFIALGVHVLAAAAILIILVILLWYFTL